MPNLKFQNSKSRSRDPFTTCKYLDSSTRFAYSVYHFHDAMIKIEGSLLRASPLLSDLAENFLSPLSHHKSLSSRIGRVLQHLNFYVSHGSATKFLRNGEKY